MTAAPTTPRTIRVTPRAARLEIVADAALDDPYAVRWAGAAPTVREGDGRIEVGYTLAARLRVLASRRSSLTVALAPDGPWAIELCGGVSGLRADLRDLAVANVLVSGGACDVVLDLPEPGGGLAVRVRGGLSRATIRRPSGITTTLDIDGGASRVRFDDAEFGAVGGAFQHHVRSRDATRGRVELSVRGGASGLQIADTEERR